MIDETRIRYFTTLCHYRNFTKAAAYMYISQPALSRQIRLLEEDLNIELINRKSKKFQLTPAGETFFEVAEEFVQQQEAFHQKVSHLDKAITSVLRVGFATEICISPLVDTVQRMHDTDPHILLLTKAYQQIQLIPLLLSSKIDVAFAFRSELEGYSGIQYETIAENYIAALISRRHRLWGRKSIAPAELQGENICITTQKLCPRSYDATLKFLQQHDVHIFENQFETCTEELLLRICCGDCVSISHMFCSELAVYDADQFARIPICGSKIHYGDLTVAYQKETADIRIFTQSIKACAPQENIDDI